MRNYDVGLKCKSDHAILWLGFRMYDKSNKRDDNVMGCRKDVRTKMRILAHVHSVFEDICKDKTVKLPFKNTKDMFVSDNFNILREAINVYTAKDDFISCW